jgi:hypothetical protein
MASASQEALLRYCNDLLCLAPPPSPPTGGAAEAALAHWDGRVGARHGAAVQAALEVLVEARFESLKRFARTVAMRSGATLEQGEVTLVFDRTESSDTSAIEFTNGDRTARSINSTNSMAVCDQGFSVGKSTWEFRLDKARGGVAVEGRVVGGEQQVSRCLLPPTPCSVCRTPTAASARASEQRPSPSATAATAAVSEAGAG